MVKRLKPLAIQSNTDGDIKLYFSTAIKTDTISS